MAQQLIVLGDRIVNIYTSRTGYISDITSVFFMVIYFDTGEVAWYPRREGNITLLGLYLV